MKVSACPFQTSHILLSIGLPNTILRMLIWQYTPLSFLELIMNIFQGFKCYFYQTLSLKFTQ